MKFFEKLPAYLVLTGYFIFSGGAVYLILNISKEHRLSFEYTIVLLGLTLIFLGVMAAKIFSEVEFNE